MRKSTLLLISVVILLSFLVLVNAATLTFSGFNPSNNSVTTTRSTNFSFTLATTEFVLNASNTLNCSIYVNNSKLFGPFNYTNNTFYNKTIIQNNGNYAYFLNCSTMFAPTLQYNVSETRFYQVNESIPSTMQIDLRSPYDYTNNIPYTTLTSTAVNFSWFANVTGGFLGSGEALNCTVYNRSSTLGNYTALFSMNTTNGTFANKTVTMVEGSRNYWIMNCSTTYNQPYLSAQTEMRVFDIESQYNTLSLGTNKVVNFTLDTGDVLAKGIITSRNNIVAQNNISATRLRLNMIEMIEPCAAGLLNGTIVFNATGNLVFCNGTAWKKY